MVSENNCGKILIVILLITKSNVLWREHNTLKLECPIENKYVYHLVT